MSEIMIPGFPMDHPAAAQATYGLYTLLPECKLKCVPRNGTYVPILQSDYKTPHEIVNFLSDKNAWEDCFKGLPEGVEVSPEEFVIFQENNPDLAAAMGTDQLLDEKGEKKNKKIIAAPTPLCLAAVRNRSNFKSLVVDKMVEYVTSHPEDTKNNLFDKLIWRYVNSQKGGGNNLSIFPENTNMNSALKGIDPKVQNVPIVCLLAVASWQSLPLFVTSRNVLVPGWLKKGRQESFHYPVFENFLSRREFMDLMLHPALTRVTYNGDVLSLRDWGVRVYRTKKVSISRGGKAALFFQTTELLS